MSLFKFIKSSAALRNVMLLVICSSIYSVNTLAANDAGIKIKWNYKGNTGPAHWGELDPSFALCQTGKFQSPINISKTMNQGTNTLMIDYHPAPMIIVDNGVTDLMLGNVETIMNTGHGIQLNFSKKETVRFNNQEYKLIQFHLHTPSENKLQGESFPLEIHFVHQGEHGTALAIGVFARIGKENPILQKILAHVPQEDGKEQIIPGEAINLYNLLPTKLNYFNFMGSLTTPPCSEGLQWIVMQETITASKAQIKKLIQITHGANARPLMPLNDRKVTFN